MRKINTTNYRRDFVVICLITVIAFIYSVVTNGTFAGKALIGGFMFTIPSALYLGWAKPKPWKRILIASLLFGLILGFFFEFIQELNRAYNVSSMIFPKLFGIVPIDNIIGHFMMALLTFTFYEHFISKTKNIEISSRVKYAIYLVMAMVVFELLLYYINQNILIINYPYVVFGTLAIIPVFIYAYRHPEYIQQLTVMVPFFFFLYLAIEIIAVKYSWWIYPGSSYIGWVNLHNLYFPFEELFFWMLFYAPALVTYYLAFIVKKD